MKNLETVVLIQAPLQTVWSKLIEFNTYHEWNPFITEFNGVAAPGQVVTIQLAIEGKPPMVIKPRVLTADVNKEFRWKGKMFVSGLFDGEHYFKLEMVEENLTRLIHGENFSGMLTKVILSMIGKQTQKGFIAMNNALKNECEASFSRHSGLTA